MGPMSSGDGQDPGPGTWAPALFCRYSGFTYEFANLTMNSHCWSQQFSDVWNFPKQIYLNGVLTVLPSSLDLLKLVPGASPRAAAELSSRRSRQPGEPLQITYIGESPKNKRLSPKRRAFFKNIKAFCHIAHDGTFHLANKPEICVFSKNWTLTAKTHVESNFLPKT